MNQHTELEHTPSTQPVPTGYLLGLFFIINWLRGIAWGVRYRGVLQFSWILAAKVGPKKPSKYRGEKTKVTH